jgi:methanogenic corrinoid protein MtbC1
MPDILKMAEEIKAVSPAAALDYDTHKESIIDEVNRLITADPSVKGLIGQNPLSVMYDNHANHAIFMSNVFLLNDYQLMIRVITWVYRSYTARGFSVEYFPATLKTWITVIGKALKPASASQITAVYKWIIDRHNLFKEASEKVILEESIFDEKWSKIQSAFHNALLSGDRQEAIKLSNDSVQTASDLAEFYLKVIQPSLYRIGVQWEMGDISVAQEHLASAIVTRVMSLLYPKFVVMEQSKGKAVVTAAPNEFHEIGARMVADLLEADGWDVDYTGANLPVEELLEFLKVKKPFLTAISVGMPFNLDKAMELVSLIRKDQQLDKMKIILGGLSISSNPQLKFPNGVDGTGSTAQDAIRLASEWWDNA